MVFKKLFKAVGRLLGISVKGRRLSRLRKKNRRKKRAVASERKKKPVRRRTTRGPKKRFLKKSPRRGVRRRRRSAKTRPRRIKKTARVRKIGKHSPVREWELIGEISHYFPRVRAAVLKCGRGLSVGDAVWIKGSATDFKQTVGSLQIGRRPIDRVARGDEIGLEVLRDVRVGDRVFLHP